MICIVWWRVYHPLSWPRAGGTSPFSCSAGQHCPWDSNECRTTYSVKSRLHFELMHIKVSTETLKMQKNTIKFEILDTQYYGSKIKLRRSIFLYLKKFLGLKHVTVPIFLFLFDEYSKIEVILPWKSFLSCPLN